MRVQRHWIPPCGTRTGLKASAVLRACSMLHETPATPSTGSEWEIQIECDPPTQQSSHAGDYGGNFTFAARATGYRRRLSRGFRTACALPAKTTTVHSRLRALPGGMPSAFCGKTPALDHEKHKDHRIRASLAAKLELCQW